MALSNCADAPLLLLESYDILSDDDDDEMSLVESFVDSLQTHQSLRNKSAKELESLTGRINACLNSKRGSASKLKGLLVLNVLVEQSSEELFQSKAFSWVTQLISKLDSDPSISNKKMTCKVLGKLFKLSPAFPELSRQISSYVQNIVNALVTLANDEAVKCLIELMMGYPGSCGGPLATKIEKLLIKNVRPGSSIDPLSLAKCFAYLPKLGGSGRDGVNHKEAWSLQFKRLLETYFDLQSTILGIIITENSNTKKSLFKDRIEKYEFPVCQRSTSYANVLYQEKQLMIVRKIIAKTLMSPFPYTKSFQPHFIFQMITELLTFTDEKIIGVSHESIVLTVIFPELIQSSIDLILTLLQACGQDLLLFVGDILNFIYKILIWTRSNGNLTDLRIGVLELLRRYVEVFGGNSGFHISCSEIIPEILIHIVPKTEKISILSSNEKPNKKKNKKKNGKITNDFQLMQKFDSKIQTSESELFNQALSTLTSIFNCCGPILRPEIHKDVQCIVLKRCLDLQQQSTILTQSPKARLGLYRLLLAVTVNFHLKFPSPLSYSIKILNTGMIRDPDSRVSQFCQTGLLICESIIHPRSPTLHIDTPLSETEMKKILEKITAIPDTFEMGSVSHRTNENKEDEKDTEKVEMVKDALNEINNEENDVEMTNNEPDAKVTTTNNYEVMKKVVITEEEEWSRKEMEEILEESKKKFTDKELMKKVYNFDRPPVVIPDHMNKERQTLENPPKSKKAKLEGGDLSLNDMLSSFVDKAGHLNELKEKFQQENAIK